MTAPTLTSDRDFRGYGLPELLVERLIARSITTPTDVQHQAIPLVGQGINLIVRAKTGTGKTFAFGLPILAELVGPKGNLPRALVITPTRELALQVHRDLEDLGGQIGLRTVAVYGGADPKAQTATLEAGVDIVVGTPGRLLDLAQQGALKLQDVTKVILDEADEMLDMGFLPDVTKLMNLAKNRSQTLMFSATMPNQIITMARQFVPSPTYVTVADPETEGRAVKAVRQIVYGTYSLDKPEILARTLQAEGRGPTIVFCRTKRWAQRLSEDMNERGFNTIALHGDLTQVARERALSSFRSNDVDILIATDVAARGIDIDGITHVVNYDAPEEAATYLHRIGRTARAGKSGTAVTFIDQEHYPRWNLIAAELEMADAINPRETFSTSDHLYTDLGIPAGTRGRLAGTRHGAAKSSSRDSERAQQRSQGHDRQRRRTRSSNSGSPNGTQARTHHRDSERGSSRASGREAAENGTSTTPRRQRRRRNRISKTNEGGSRG